LITLKLILQSEARGASVLNLINFTQVRFRHLCLSVYLSVLVVGSL